MRERLTETVFEGTGSMQKPKKNTATGQEVLERHGNGLEGLVKWIRGPLITVKCYLK